MQESPPLRRILASFALSAMSLLGCDSGGELLIPAEGMVTLQGRRLQDGAVSFRPDASQGNMSLHHPTGSIDVQGRYRMFVGRRAGVPPGCYKVVIFANETILHDPNNVHPGMPKSLIDRRYNSPQTTPLSVEIAPDMESATFDFDVEPAA